MDPIGMPIDAFCEQIRDQARREAARHLDQAGRAAAEIAAQRRAEAAALREQTVAQSRLEAERQRRRILANVSVETKKTRLRAEGEIIAETVKGIRARLAALRGSPEWRAFLRDTIAEAAVAFDEASITLIVAPADAALVEGGVLQEAVRAAEARAGHPIRISVKADADHSGTGIVAVARGGHTTFNNTAEARLERRLTALSVLIHRECFPAG